MGRRQRRNPLFKRARNGRALLGVPFRSCSVLRARNLPSLPRMGRHAHTGSLSSRLSLRGEDHCTCQCKRRISHEPTALHIPRRLEGRCVSQPRSLLPRPPLLGSHHTHSYTNEPIRNSPPVCIGNREAQDAANAPSPHQGTRGASNLKASTVLSQRWGQVDLQRRWPAGSHERKLGLPSYLAAGETPASVGRWRPTTSLSHSRVGIGSGSGSGSGAGSGRRWLSSST